jgi:hypothetical protein
MTNFMYYLLFFYFISRDAPIFLKTSKINISQPGKTNFNLKGANTNLQFVRYRISKENNKKKVVPREKPPISPTQTCQPKNFIKKIPKISPGERPQKLRELTPGYIF